MFASSSYIQDLSSCLYLIQRSDNTTQIWTMSHPSISTDAEKGDEIGMLENGNGIENAQLKKENEAAVEELDEYPKGFRLAMVILALVLSVFLVALDLVCVPNPSKRCAG